ncbi:MAG: hypothetical protein NC311_10055 [Muribaculaceae bacterium]|nr:hypothetical protein [Muribaculaceae bacterium]
MRLDSNLELRLAVVPDEAPDKTYDSVACMAADYPDAQPVFGARIVSAATGFAARGYDAFYRSADAAFNAWSMRRMAN